MKKQRGEELIATNITEVLLFRIEHEFIQINNKTTAKSI